MEVFFTWLIDRFEALYCGFMVRPYERAVHIRSGELLRVCKPGFYLKQPFEIDEIHKVNVVTTTSNLDTQVVTTADDYTLVVGVVLRWRVKEDFVARLIIELEDYETVLHDTAYGMVARTFLAVKAAELSLPDIEQKILEAVRRRVGKFGFDVEDLFVTDISSARTFRLVNGNS